MNTSNRNHNPRAERFINLVGDLQNDVKTLIKKEIELAKTEMAEKVSALGRNVALGAIGGVIGLMAAFLLILGLGAIAAQGLISAGLSAGVSYFVAYLGLALVLGGAGYALIQKAISALKRMSFSPEKALVSLQAAEPVPIEIRKKLTREPTPHKPSCEELQHEVIAARTRMDSEIGELKDRLMPGYLARSFMASLKHHPLRMVLLSAASTGIGGILYYRRRQRLAMIKRQASRLHRWFNIRHA